MSHSLQENPSGELSHKRSGQNPSAARVVANFKSSYRSRLCQDAWDLMAVVSTRIQMEKSRTNVFLAQQGALVKQAVLASQGALARSSDAEGVGATGPAGPTDRPVNERDLMSKGRYMGRHGGQPSRVWIGVR